MKRDAMLTLDLLEPQVWWQLHGAYGLSITEFGVDVAAVIEHHGETKCKQAQLKINNRAEALILTFLRAICQTIMLIPLKCSVAIFT